MATERRWLTRMPGNEPAARNAVAGDQSLVTTSDGQQAEIKLGARARGRAVSGERSRSPLRLIGPPIQTKLSD